MTLIVGAKCIDGVVMVADRKVGFAEFGKDEFVDKLFIPYSPIVIGCSGGIEGTNMFKPQAERLAMGMHQKFDNTFPATSGAVFLHPTDDESVRIDIVSYLDNLRATVERINSEVARKGYERFDVLLAVQTKDEGALLYYIDTDGVLITENEFKVVGTGGPYARMFLKPMWRPPVSKETVMEMGCLAIRYVEGFSVDTSIGAGGEGPQILFVPNKGDLYQPDRETIKKLLSHADERMSSIWEALAE